MQIGCARLPSFVLPEPGHKVSSRVTGVAVLSGVQHMLQWKVATFDINS